eukprot:764835-Hanusia_phi.AAC.3
MQWRGDTETEAKGGSSPAGLRATLSSCSRSAEKEEGLGAEQVEDASGGTCGVSAHQARG